MNAVQGVLLCKVLSAADVESGRIVLPPQLVEVTLPLTSDIDQLPTVNPHPTASMTCRVRCTPM